MTKIVHIIEHLQTGGEENLLVSLVEEMQHHFPHGAQQWIVTLKGGSAPLERALDSGLTIINLQGTSKRKLLWRLKNELLSIGPDIVHTRLSSAGYWGRMASLIALCGTKRIHGHGGNTFKEGGMKRLVLEKMLAPFTHRQICVSESVKSHLLEHGFNPDALTVIPNGIPTTIPTRKAFFKGPDVAFFCVGRLEYVKGHDILIEALARIKRNSQLNFRLDIVGDGNERTKLEKMIAQLGLEKHVRLLGEMAGASDKIHQYDAFILPSRSEGLSLSLLEAMAAGVPVIATNVGESADVLAKYGTIVPPNDAEGLSRALEDFIIAPSEPISLAQATPSRIKQEFGIEQTARSYAQLFTNILQEKRQ